MVKYLDVPVGENGKSGIFTVEIELAEDTSGLEKMGVAPEQIENRSGIENLGGIDDVAKKAVQSLKGIAKDAFEQISDTAYSIACGVRDTLITRIDLDSVSVEFGIAIKADAGVVVAKAGAEGTFKVTLNFKKSQSLS